MIIDVESFKDDSHFQKLHCQVVAGKNGKFLAANAMKRGDRGVAIRASAFAAGNNIRSVNICVICETPYTTES